MITTAAIPGRPAPRLIPAAAVERMRPGSVIVDLAAETGGNCELTQPGRDRSTSSGVTIIGPLNLPSTMPTHASQLYARNVVRAPRRTSRPGGELHARLGRRDHAPATVRARGAKDAEAARMSHYAQLVVELTILALAIFLGVEVISKVPTLLHTPLMSGTNAIHGIVIVGAMLVAGDRRSRPAHGLDRLRRDDPRRGERGRRLRRHRPDARDVQEARAAARRRRRRARGR